MRQNLSEHLHVLTSRPNYLERFSCGSLIGSYPVIPPESSLKTPQIASGNGRETEVARKALQILLLPKETVPPEEPLQPGELMNFRAGGCAEKKNSQGSSVTDDFVCIPLWCPAGRSHLTRPTPAHTTSAPSIRIREVKTATAGVPRTAPSGIITDGPSTHVTGRTCAVGNVNRNVDHSKYNEDGDDTDDDAFLIGIDTDALIANHNAARPGGTKATTLLRPPGTTTLPSVPPAAAFAQEHHTRIAQPQAQRPIPTSSIGQEPCTHGYVLMDCPHLQDHLLVRV
jgi:hypothetical protein